MRELRGRCAAPTTYTTAVVSLVDLLGFKTLLATKPPKEIFETLTEIRKLKTVRIEEALQGEIGTRTYYFSDLIVNVMPLFDGLSDESKFYRIFGEIEMLGRSQFELAAKGLFVRGGIAIGPIFAEEDNILFGPALVDAYELESKSATWPIIAVQDKILGWAHARAPGFLSSRVTRDGPDSEWVASLCLKTMFSTVSQLENSVHYVDYLQCMAIHDSTDGELDYKLHDHKVAVVSAIKAFKHYKYNFIAEYHNAKCRQYLPGANDLLIDGYTK